MSLWNWLLAAWIFEEVFDDDADDRPRKNNRDALYDHDDYDADFEEFDDDF